MAYLKIEPVINITSVQQFVSSVLKVRKNESNHKLWYRGVSNCAEYELKPTVGRQQKYANEETILTPGAEKSLLHRFRRRVFPHFGRILPLGEAIFIARHHGLPTRLLDWTANALFALYFASYEHLGKDKKDGKVWGMTYKTDENYLDVFDVAEWDEKKLFAHDDRIKILHPLFNTPRLLAQDGAFTLHFNPRKSIEEYDRDGQNFKDGNLDIKTLYPWNVPAGKKPKIIKQLSGLGITHRAMFPDLDGIAKSLWETEVLWNENKVGPAKR